MSGETPKLSSNVLQMKFMQRSVLRIEEEKNAEERQKVIDEEHWVLDLPELKQREELFIQQPSLTFCENLQYGRMSFKGFNPDVEKLMSLHNSELESQQSEEREKEIGVDDKEMTARYSTLVGAIGRKFSSKRKKKEEEEAEKDRSDDELDSEDDELTVSPASAAKSKRKFMKPAD